MLSLFNCNKIVNSNNYTNNQVNKNKMQHNSYVNFKSQYPNDEFINTKEKEQSKQNIDNKLSDHLDYMENYANETENLKFRTEHIKYYPEDIKIMLDMELDERIKYRRYLKENNQYIIQNNNIENRK